MVERDDDHFDLDDDFAADSDEDHNYERFIEKVDRRTRPGAAPAKKGKAAWSKLEDVLAERRLQRQLSDYFDEE